MIILKLNLKFVILIYKVKKLLSIILEKKEMNKKFSILIILTVTNFIGFLLLLYNHYKNLKTLQKLTEQTKIENQLAFAQLQSYLEDNFLEQNKIIETTNSIAIKNKKAQAEQTEIISNDMTEGLSLMKKKKYEQTRHTPRLTMGR